jgi:uncharacterized membrane protein
LESLFSKSKQVGQIRVKEDSSEIGGVFPFRDIVYILIITLLILILIYFYLRKIRTKTNTIIPNQNRNEEIENILKSLSKYSSQSLSTQQLDEVLRIDSLVNEDTKRLKRSRWINKLNELQNSMNGTDLIVRDKSVEDKRFVFYRINK